MMNKTAALITTILLSITAIGIAVATGDKVKQDMAQQAAVKAEKERGAMVLSLYDFGGVGGGR